MRKYAILLLLSFIFIGSVSAVIEDSWINPDEPSCSDSIEVCVEISNSSILNFLKISCNAGTTQVNKTLFSPRNDDIYCTGISNRTIGVVDGMNVVCNIYLSEDTEAFFTETVETTYDCPQPVCGDDLINQANETCDDGGLNGILCDAGYESFCNYCTNECLIEEVQGNYCGDGIFDLPQEECDNASLNGEVCSALYGESCNYCSNSCEVEVIYGGFCEDGICNGDENWTSCSVDCEKPAICNDGVLDVGEICDEVTGNGILCSAGYEDSCQYCSLSCVYETVYGPYCGDGICEGEEEDCDNCRKDCNEGVKYDLYDSITPYEIDCDPDWDCSEWAECVDGVKQRDCVDLNHCAVGYNEPAGTVSCDIIMSSKVESSENLFFKIFTISAFILLLILLLVLIRRR